MKNLLLVFLMLSLLSFFSCEEEEESSVLDEVWALPCEITSFSINGLEIPTVPLARNAFGGAVDEISKSDLPEGALQAVGIEFLVPTQDNYTLVFNEVALSNQLKMHYNGALAFDMSISIDEILGTTTLDGQLYQIVQVTGSTSRDNVTKDEFDRITFSATFDYLESETGEKVNSRFGQTIDVRL